MVDQASTSMPGWPSYGVTVDELNPRRQARLRSWAMVRIGVDLGQRLDPTAIVVVEIQQRGGDPDENGCIVGGHAHYVVRSAIRLELGTSYPAVVRRLVEIDRRLVADGWFADLWVDATGLGKPVVDLLRNASLNVREVYLNGTDQAIEGENRELRLGKALLVSRLQVLLQSERIHLPATPEAGLLVDELLNYEIRINDNPHAQFGAFRLGSHDDLATALGLACYEEHSFAPSGYSIPPRDVIAEADSREISWYGDWRDAW